MSLWLGADTKPYPYDLYLEEVGLVLKPKTDGQFVGRESKPLTAQPASYEYGSNSPFLEATYPFKHLVLGMGEMVQPTGTPRRYRFALNMDLSINGKWILGPRFHMEDVNLSGASSDREIRGFINGIHDGSPTLFCLAGTTIRRRVTDGEWVDVGSPLATGECWQQAVRWTHPGATGDAVNRVYFTSSNSNLAYYDGVNLVIMDGTHGPEFDTVGHTLHFAQWIEAVGSGSAGSELWVAYNNYVSKCEGDPSDTASWAAPIRVGDASSNTTWLRQNKNQLYIFKTKGIFTLSAAGTAQDLYPAFRQIPDVKNGRNAAVWLDELYVPFKESFFKIQTDAQIKPIGTEQLLENDTEVRGAIVASAGHNTWQNYEIIYNELNGNSYLLKYGTWMESEDTRVQPVRISSSILQLGDVHHGALAKFAGKRATCMDILQSTATGAPDRLYIGFSDGTIAWCFLPRHSPNPASDPNCEFTTDDAYVYWPIHNAGFASDYKLFRGFSIFGPKLSVNRYATIDYRLSPNAAWTTLQDEALDPVDDAQFTSPNRRVDLPAGSNLTGKSIEVRTVFHAVDPINYDDTVVLDGCAIHELVRPAFVEEYTFTAQARNFAPKRDGTVDWRSAHEIRQKLVDVVSRVGTAIMVLPSGEEQEVVFNDYAESLISPENRWGAIEWEITVKGVQYKSLTSINTSQILHTLTYGELEQYTYGQLETLF